MILKKELNTGRHTGINTWRKLTLSGFQFSMIIILSVDCHAQVDKKVIYGSFVLESKVFQYQYKRAPGVNTIKISTLEPVAGMAIDPDKLQKTSAYVDGALNATNLEKIKGESSFLQNASAKMLDTLSLIPVYLKNIIDLQNNKSKWIKDGANINRVLEIADSARINNIKVADTVTTNVYNVLDLLNYYKQFITKNSDPSSSDEVPFSEFNIKEFRIIFSNQLNSIILFADSKEKQNAQEKIVSKADDIFYEIKAKIDFKEDEPKTAYIFLKRKYLNIDIPIPRVKVEQKTPQNDTVSILFEVKNITIEFEDGGIKNVFADLFPIVKEYQAIYAGSTLRFRNIKPISIAGKFDPEQFRYHTIYAGNTFDLINTLYAEASRQHSKVRYNPLDFQSRNYVSTAGFILSNLIDYKVISETDNEDYSPTNSKVELSEPFSIIELKKEKRSKILSAKAYTDFIGLNDDQPNGLVQIEVSKRVNIISGRYQGLWYTKILKGNRSGIYTGGLAFIEPKLTFSKIEENNRYLTLDSNAVDRISTSKDSTGHFNINPLDIQRYSQWNFGIDVNLLKLNHHNRKSNFQINGMLAFGRTNTADSLNFSNGKITQIQSRNIRKISTTTYGISILYEVKPDSRYGFSFGYDFKWQDVLEPNFNYQNGLSNGFHSAWFNGFIKVGEESKMFWRFKKNWLIRNSSFSFYQLQLGYELEIFKANN